MLKKKNKLSLPTSPCKIMNEVGGYSTGIFLDKKSPSESIAIGYSWTAWEATIFILGQEPNTITYELR